MIIIPFPTFLITLKMNPSATGLLFWFCDSFSLTRANYLTAALKLPEIDGGGVISEYLTEGNYKHCPSLKL